MNNYTGLEVAIIGMSGRFPGAANISEFWSNLKNGVESVSSLTDEEVLGEGEDADLVRHPLYVRASAFLSDKGYFDSAFFNYRPEEAMLMDPQMRIFHECCWEAMEDAGYADIYNDKRIGLFAGAAPNINWDAYAVLENRKGIVDNYSAAQLRDITFLCSRISYSMNLQGPSMFISTACSTSLVAIQRAVMSLLLRECNMALAGGVAIYNHSKKGYLYQEGMINSRDGHCRAFDAGASGTVGGEGAGVIMLKRLEDAIRDNDNIYAVIKGSAINNDGFQKMSFTAPSVEGQYKAIVKAINTAGVGTESISYVEAHGTGTVLGDPVELEALTLAFGRSEEKYCGIGSVKTNIGHLDAAAGVAGLIKVVLSLQHRMLVPSLHFRVPNPKIDFGAGPFYVNTELREWRGGRYPLRAGVSSFGIGGTNAHVVVEEAPQQEAGSESRSSQLLLFSARTVTALEGNLMRMRTYLQEHEEVNLADMAYTLQTGRTAFGYRVRVVCRDREEALMQLSGGRLSEQVVPVRGRGCPPVVFMFPGQGTQYYRMCYGLYEEERGFREAAEECFEIVRRISGKDLKAVVYGPAGTGESSKIDRTGYAQPLLFIMGYSLSRLLGGWGIRPDKMIGHSIGEYVAACISGVFGLEDALRLVVRRGELMEQVEAGVMSGINISEEELSPFLSRHGEVSLAAVNGPGQCVVSGREAPVDGLVAELKGKGYESKRLVTSHAFHSAMMEGVLGSFEQAVREVKLGGPEIPFVSNVTGELVSAAMVCDVQYWVRHLRQTVQFSKGIGRLLDKEEVILVEVGPGRSLSGMVRGHERYGRGHRVIGLVRHVKESKDDIGYLLSGLGALWAAGVAPDWLRFYEGERRRKVSLPSYCFDRIAYPVHVDAFRMVMELGMQKKRLSGQADRRDWWYVPSWKLLPAAGRGQGDGGGCTLVLLDDNGVCWGLAERYRAEGVRVVSVSRGDGFRELSAVEYELSGQGDEQYEELFGRLSAHGLLPVRIIHGWGIGGGVQREDAVLSMEVYFHSIRSVVRSWCSHAGAAERSLIILSSDLHPVVESGPVAAVKSLSVGLLKVLTQEYGISGRHIDMSLAEGEGGRLSQELYRELECRSEGGVVSLRHGRSWEQIYERLSGVSFCEGEVLRQGGVYLITGGLGAAGYHISEYLLKRYAAKLILTGRTVVSGQGEGAEKKKRLERLRGQGGEVVYRSCDVSDSRQMEEVIRQSEEQLGPVNGVFHLAGVTSGRSIGGIGELSREDIAEQVASKIKGIEVLDGLFGERELDFCLVTSTLSTVLGGLGLGAYGAANMYMDYYIRSQRNKGRLNNWVSADLDGIEPERGQGAWIGGEDLMVVMEGLLSVREQGRVVVSVSDLQERLDKWVYRRSEETVEGMVEDLGVPVREAGVVDSIEGRMQQLWQQFFGKGTIGADEDFFEMGGDSLKALTLVSRMHRLFGIGVSMAEFFNRPTIRGLSEYIAIRGESSSGYRSIPVAAKKDYYRLSSAQKRLYFLYEFDRDSLSYNLNLTMELDGRLDRVRLQQAFEGLLQRHESLRTCFELVNGEAVQRVMEGVGFGIEEWEALPEQVAAIIKGFIRPFDLSRAPLIRVGLIRTAETEHILMMDIHHLVADGVSLNVLTREFMSLYNRESLPPLRLQYKDYAEWQLSQAGEEKQGWVEEFSGQEGVLELPTDYERPAVKDFGGSAEWFRIGVTDTKRLKRLAEQEGATLFMVMLAIYQVLLSKVSNQQDIVVGISTSGRQHADVEEMVGMFVNTLPLRSRVEGDRSFREYLSGLRSKVLVCFDQQDQYEQLLDEVRMERDMSRNPFFDAMFIFQNYGEVRLDIPGLILKPYNRRVSTSKFDLSLTVAEAGEELFMEFEYSTELFKGATIDRFIGYVRAIVASVIEGGDVRIGAIGVLSAQERWWNIEGYNATAMEVPGDETVLSLFGRQAEAVADRIAISYGEGGMSYRELNELSDRIAEYLQQQAGVVAGELVGIMLEREEWLVPTMLGILKAGAAYVPIDPLYPEGRVEAIAADAGLGVVIMRGDKGGLTGVPRVVDLDVAAAAIVGKEGGGGRRTVVRGDDLAYVIYTSGSTGVPKGVMIEHRSLLNYVLWAASVYIREERAVFALYTSISFDLTVTSIFTPLIVGQTIRMYREEGGATLIGRVMADNGSSIIKLTPSHLKLIADMEGKEEVSVKRFIVGGEELRSDVAREIYDRFDGRVELYNEYGPTEATVGCMLHRFDREQGEVSVPIGVAAANMRIYLLDKCLQPVPNGTRAELYIAGEGVARGYLNRPELTAERFIADPFRAGGRMYRTGDYGSRRENGDIVFRGRRDDQVKVRGYRIEPAEIASNLCMHEAIKRAVVVARGEGSAKYLAGYYVSDREIGKEELKEYLSARLPDYMVPGYLIQIAEVPLNANGKPDIKALPAPETSREGEPAGPVNQTQKDLVAIWADVLAIPADNIGVNKNFFELGGNSIRLIKMLNKVNKHFGRQIPVAKMFEFPMISSMANFLKNGGDKTSELEEGLEERTEALDLLKVQTD